MYFYIYICVYLFILGACIGSFINVMAYRIPNKISVTKGRSRCDYCGEQLKIYDLIPILSYLLLRGRCRYCKKKLGKQYVLAEAVCGLITVLCFLIYGFSAVTVFACIVAYILLLIALTDINTMEIPDSAIIALAVMAVIGALIKFNDISLLSRVIGFFIISLPMFGLVCLIPDCFGGGDIKLIAVCGFILGWKNTLLAMFFALIIAGVPIIFLMLTKKLDRGKHIPFGPQLCAGVFIAMLWGEPILNWYLGLLMPM